MHELSIAEGIISSVITEARGHGAKKIIRVYLEIGQLAMVDIEQLRFVLECLSGNTPLENADIDMRITPIVIRCGNGHEEITSWDPFNHVEKFQCRCSVCGDPVKIVRGRACIIKKIVVE